MKRTGQAGIEAMLAVIALVILLAVGIATLHTWSPGFRAAVNGQQYRVQKADDATRYETLRTVEDTCRAMQASYRSDIAAYKAYAEAGDVDLATQMLIRINRTACTYNEYMRKNSFVWKGAVPRDIDENLAIVTR